MTLSVGNIFKHWIFHAETLRFFMLYFQSLFCVNTVLMVGLGLGTNTLNGSGWEQIMFSTNMTENCLSVSVKISSGFTRTNTDPQIPFSIDPPLMLVIKSGFRVGLHPESAGWGRGQGFCAGQSRQSTQKRKNPDLR